MKRNSGSKNGKIYQDYSLINYENNIPLNNFVHIIIAILRLIVQKTTVKCWVNNFKSSLRSYM